MQRQTYKSWPQFNKLLSQIRTINSNQLLIHEDFIEFHQSFLKYRADAVDIKTIA